MNLNNFEKEFHLEEKLRGTILSDDERRRVLNGTYQVVLNSQESKSYVEHSKMAKKCILEVIENEGILLKTSFLNSMNGEACYVQINKTRPGIRTSTHLIIIPQFTDESEMIQAITLAHELGHFYVYQTIKETKDRFLWFKIKASNYYNECLAWRRAEELLRELNIIAKYNQGHKGQLIGNKEQVMALNDFLHHKDHCLSTYRKAFFHKLFKPFRFLTHTAKLLIYFLFISYFIVGIVFVFDKNNIPIPIDFDISNESFYDYVFVTFQLLGCAYLLGTYTIWRIKSIVKS